MLRKGIKGIEMWKIMMVAAFALSLGLSGTALAADIGNLSGQSCGDDSGTWHFVNPQTHGADPGFLMAVWSSGDTCSVSASKVSKNNQHFNCVASGELVSATTGDLPENSCCLTSAARTYAKARIVIAKARIASPRSRLRVSSEGDEHLCSTCERGLVVHSRSSPYPD